MAYGMFNRNDSAQFEYDVESFDARYFDVVRELLAEQLALSQVGREIVGLDERMSEYQRNGLHIGIEWDIWSGLCIRALQPDAEALVKEIGERIEQIPGFSRYLRTKP